MGCVLRKILILRVHRVHVTLLVEPARRRSLFPRNRSPLADIYGWFTEGFDSADLKDAKALLDQLSA
jgi:hypothetical protein